MKLRDATPEDLPAILAIFNSVIERSTAVWRDAPVALEDRAAWFAQRKAGGFPVIVAEDEGQVIGYASFGDFRTGSGYRYTAEHSIHIAEGWRRAGVGTALMREIIARAKGKKLHMLIAGVDGENAASIAFHQRFGFVEAARLREVGRKFDRWIDLLLLQLPL
jgi:L-amino acid N-acyltransferase YncA